MEIEIGYNIEIVTEKVMFGGLIVEENKDIVCGKIIYEEGVHRLQCPSEIIMFSLNATLNKLWADKIKDASIELSKDGEVKKRMVFRQGNGYVADEIKVSDKEDGAFKVKTGVFGRIDKVGKIEEQKGLFGRISIDIGEVDAWVMKN